MSAIIALGVFAAIINLSSQTALRLNRLKNYSDLVAKKIYQSDLGKRDTLGNSVVSIVMTLAKRGWAV